MKLLVVVTQTRLPENSVSIKAVWQWNFYGSSCLAIWQSKHSQTEQQFWYFRLEIGYSHTRSCDHSPFYLSTSFFFKLL